MEAFLKLAAHQPDPYGFLAGWEAYFKEEISRTRNLKLVRVLTDLRQAMAQVKPKESPGGSFAPVLESLVEDSRACLATRLPPPPPPPIADELHPQPTMGWAMVEIESTPTPRPIAPIVPNGAGANSNLVPEFQNQIISPVYSNVPEGKRVASQRAKARAKAGARHVGSRIVFPREIHGRWSPS